MATIINPLTWNELFDELQPILERGDEQIKENKQNILKLLQRYKSEQVDYKEFCFFEQDGYSKNLVKSFGRDCNVIIMCWAAGQASAIHGHEGSKCFVKVLEGNLMEQRFPHPDLEPKKSYLNTHERLMVKDDVCYIDDSVGVHRVANTTSQAAVTLHIYIPAYTKCRVFDPSMSCGSTIEVKFTSSFGKHNSD